MAPSASCPCPRGPAWIPRQDAGSSQLARRHRAAATRSAPPPRRGPRSARGCHRPRVGVRPDHHAGCRTPPLRPGQRRRREECPRPHWASAPSEQPVRCAPPARCCWRPGAFDAAASAARRPPGLEWSGRPVGPLFPVAASVAGPSASAAGSRGTRRRRCHRRRPGRPAAAARLAAAGSPARTSRAAARSPGTWPPACWPPPWASRHHPAASTATTHRWPGRTAPG